MKPSLKAKFFVYGSFEVVAEACMRIWNSTALAGMRSDGIRAVDPVDNVGMYVFECDCDVPTGAPQGFSEALSKECKTTLVGHSVVDLDIRTEGPEHCFWGAGAHIDGTEVLTGITGSIKSSLPPELVALVDDSNDAGALPRTSIPALHDYARLRFQQEAIARVSTAARSRAEPQASEEPGWARWSLLTHSVASLGLGGFSNNTIPASKPLTLSHILTLEGVKSFRAGVASWADTLFFGSRTPSNDVDDVRRAPYSSLDVSIWDNRRIGMLTYLATAQDDDQVAAGLVTALSSPHVTFRDGTHPLPWLASFPVRSAAESAGLRKLIAGARQQLGEFNGDVLTHAQRAARSSGYSQESLETLLAMGRSPGYTASVLLPTAGASDAEQLRVGVKLLEGFCGIFGSYADFPTELERAFQDAHDAIAQAFEAKRTEEMMRKTIGDWSATAHASSTNGVEVTAKRRRRATI